MIELPNGPPVHQRRQPARFEGKLTGIPDRGEPIELGPDGPGPERGEARLVHRASIEIADLAGRCPGSGIRACGVLGDGSKIRVGAFGHLREGTPGDTVGGNLRRRQPSSVDVAVQVVLWPDREIEVAELQS
jgi:hypothetical protein